MGLSIGCKEAAIKRQLKTELDQEANLQLSNNSSTALYFISQGLFTRSILRHGSKMDLIF